MRQVLFQIPLDQPWSLGPLGKVQMFGFGFLLLAWALFGVQQLYVRYRRGDKPNIDDFWNGVWWSVVAAGLLAAPLAGAYLRKHGEKQFQDGLPIFGYGFMLFIAVTSAGWLAARRVVKQGLPSDKIWDLVVCLFLSGICGARLFYLIEYRNVVFENVTTPQQFVLAIISLWNGGIVLYGGLIAAAFAYFTFCYANRIRSLALLDIITPSIFLGIGFGRIGCFLNGCCYGDQSTLPWAVQFPRESATFGALVYKGIIKETAACTPPLHPTQIYSTIDGFILAALTLWYYRHRRRNGEVFAIGLMLYPITRFLIEFLRADEPTLLLLWSRYTISQWISLAMSLVGVGYVFYLSRRPVGLQSLLEEPEKTTATATRSSLPTQVARQPG